MSSVTYNFLGNSRSRGFSDVPLATVVLHRGLRESSGHHYTEHSRELLRKIADALRVPAGVGISIVRESARPNPTLYHHGAGPARWHVSSPDAGVADLYGIGPEQAAKVVQAIADALGVPLTLASNQGTPETHSLVRSATGSTYFRRAETRTNPHRGARPWAGETWRGIDGRTDRVVSVIGSRVQVLHLESGNREWLDLGDFMATHKPPAGARKNPKRRRVYGCKLHGGAHDYTVCPKCNHQYCPQHWPGCPRCAERSLNKNPGRDIHRAAPAVGSYLSRLSYPGHIARVVAVRRAAGGAPPMVRLDIVTGRGQVMGSTELPLEDVLQGYEPLPASSPYRKTLPNPKRAQPDWHFIGDVESLIQNATQSPRGLSPEEFDFVAAMKRGTHPETAADLVLSARRGGARSNPARVLTEAQALKRARALYGPSGWVRRGQMYEVGYLTHFGSAFEITAESPAGFDDALAKAEADPNAPSPCVCEDVRTLPSPGVWSVDDGWGGFHSPNKCWLPHESTMGLVGGMGTLVRRTKTGEIKESNYSRRPKWTKQDLAGNIERGSGDGGPFGKPASNPGHSRACSCGSITPPNKLVWKLETGYEGVHSWGKCWLPNMTDRGGVEIKASGQRKTTRGVPGWVQDALDSSREYAGPLNNPKLRISGTINVSGAGRRRSKRAPRSSRPKLAVVPRARAKRGRTEHARRALEPGEGVTVPYTGRSSYFGRPVKRTREPATVLGYTSSSAGGELVQVQVRRGRSAEVHEFPAHLVRRRPSRASRYKSESEKHPEVRQRLEAAVGGDQSKGLHLLELAHSELEAANQTAEALRPQAGERPSPDYMAARRTEKKALARTQALEGIVGRIQRSAPGYQDPFAIANPSGRMTSQHAKVIAGWLRAGSTPKEQDMLAKYLANRNGWPDYYTVSRWIKEHESRRTNPRGDREAAEKTFRMWHEFDSSRTTKVHGPDRVIPGTLVKLGDLISVTYRSDKYAGGPDNPSGSKLLYEHKTKKPYPVLATDPQGQFVHIVGGRMRVTGDGLVN